MPQTYIRAVGPGAVGRTSPVAVSSSRSGSPVPGSVGDVGAGQACTAGSYVGAAGSERRPGDRRPALDRERQAALARAAGRPDAGWRAPRPAEQPGQRACRASPSRCVAQLLRAPRPRRAAAAHRPSPTARCAASARRGRSRRGRRRAPRRPASTSTCPPLRSALLSTTSSTAIRRSRVVVGVREHDRLAVRAECVQDAQPARGEPTGRHDVDQRGVVASTVSTHSCTMPGPNGPSRRTVGGTTPQPVASDTAYAATSRPASVPSGKSHSGRSPATGL